MKIKHFILPLWFAALTAAALPIANYDMESFLIATILLTLSTSALIFTASAQNTPLTLPKTIILPIAFAFWTLACLSTAFSETKAHSFFFLIFFSTFPLSAIVIYCTLKMKIASLKPFIIFGAIAGFALAANAFIQYAFFQDAIMFGRPHLPLANPNNMAGLVSLFIFGTFGAFLACQKKAHKIIALTLMVFLFAAFIMIGSRGAFLALIGGMGILATLLFPQIRTHWKYIAPLAIACILVFIGYELYDSTNTLGGNLAKTNIQNIQNFWHRADIWSAGLVMAKDHLWHGTGIGTFSLYYPEYRVHDVKSSGFTAHNDPLQFAIEMGILAPILFYAFIIAAIALTTRAFIALKKDTTHNGNTQRITLTTSFCALSAFIAHTHITYHFSILVLLMSAGATLAIWLHTALNAAPPTTITLKNTKLAHGILFALLCLSMAIFIPLQIGNIYARKAGEAKHAGNLVAMITYINKADKITAGHNAKALILAAQISLSTLQLDTNGQLTQQQRKDAFDRGMTILAQAQKINPREITIYSTRAIFHTQMGQTAKAQAQWDTFRKLIWEYSE